LAAFTNVSAAEEQRDNKKGSCWKVNVVGTENLLKTVKGTAIHFIYISTDMVFSGSEEDPGPYSEDHPRPKDKDKITWYGHTKATAEELTLQYLGQKSTILRLIYPVRAHFDGKLDYLRRPLSLYNKGELYPLFTDQQVSISFIDEIALVLDKIIARGAYGVFHASSSNTSTPYELVSYMVRSVGKDASQIKTTSLDNFLKSSDNSVRYPKHGGLSSAQTSKALDVKFSSCKQIIDQLIAHGLS
jgi:dTDP-4-dehydrorhamnose reductase